MTGQLNYETLKERRRTLRDDFPQALSLRTHRALSWLKRAEQETDDDDARFIFLWIAFNAAYSNEMHEDLRFAEAKLFLHLLSRLIESDNNQLLYQIVWGEFPNSIRLLIDNKYVFQPFWEHTKGNLTEDE